VPGATAVATGKHPLFPRCLNVLYRTSDCAIGEICHRRTTRRTGDGIRAFDATISGPDKQHEMNIDKEEMIAQVYDIKASPPQMATTDFGALQDARKRMWAVETWQAGRDQSFWFSNGFIGKNSKDSGAIIQRVTELTETERGLECVMQLVQDLQGDGVVGDYNVTSSYNSREIKTKREKGTFNSSPVESKISRSTARIRRWP
jgi:hypothetical protein